MVRLAWFSAIFIVITAVSFAEPAFSQYRLRFSFDATGSDLDKIIVKHKDSTSARHRVTDIALDLVTCGMGSLPRRFMRLSNPAGMPLGLCFRQPYLSSSMISFFGMVTGCAAPGEPIFRSAQLNATADILAFGESSLRIRSGCPLFWPRFLI